MNSFKVLHTADIHFDTPFESIPANIAHLRKDDVFKSFSKLIDLAKEEKVDAILIAGDLFDSQYVKPMTIKYLQNIFSKIPEIMVFIAPGNHDYINENSIFKTIEFPQNVYVFKGDMERVRLKDKNVSIYGAAFTSQFVNESLLKGFSADDENEINIGVIHGTIITCGEYNPMAPSDIENSKLDYLALGHVHEYLGATKFGKTTCCYCGTLEGKGFDEAGEKGAVICEISKENISVRFIPLCQRQYINLKCDISEAKTYDDIVEIIINNMGKDREKHLYKIILEGEVDKDLHINTNILCQRLQNETFFVKIEDKTSIRLDLGSLANQPGLKGAFVRELLEKSGDPHFKEALKLGFLAFDGAKLEEII